ncbi:MAG TPA: hypothetical protein VMZ91_08165 [Candidatus Paceibacterota bacterium]|nr:hypothetical protein [Candidatus Paceibacterota bacterium]
MICEYCGLTIIRQGIVLKRLCNSKKKEFCSMNCYDNWEAEEKEGKNEELK